jgi:hypothetical protein
VEGFKAGVLYVLGRHDLSRCNTHGRSFETLVSGIGSGYSVSVDAPNGVVYWSDYNGTGVFGATLQVIGVLFWGHFKKKTCRERLNSGRTHYLTGKHFDPVCVFVCGLRVTPTNS